MNAWLFLMGVVAACFLAGSAAGIMLAMVLEPFMERRRRERELRRLRAECLLHWP